MEPIRNCPGLDQLESFWELENGTAKKIVILGRENSLANCKVLSQFTELESLVLRSIKLPASVWIDLASLTRLRELRCDNVAVDCKGLPQLRSCQQLGALRLTSRRLKRLTASEISKLSSLEDLDLTSVPIAEISPLLDLKKLHSCSLIGTSITDQSLEIMPHFAVLHKLQLEGTSITDKGMRHLVGCESLRELTFTIHRSRLLRMKPSANCRIWQPSISTNP